MVTYKWLRLLRDGINELHAVEGDIVRVPAFQKAVNSVYADTYLEGVVPTALEVYANEAASKDGICLAPTDWITKNMGISENPIIVQAPSAYPMTPLPNASGVEQVGMTKRDPIIVQVPSPPSPYPTTPLPNASDVEQECASMDTWAAGQVYEIPHIHNFMKPLGGCATNGKVYWREEERQVASILLGELTWPLAQPERGVGYIVVGCPGVGKSTMLCVLAFHLVFVKKWNVLVIHQWVKQSCCLFFLGRKGNQVVCHTNTVCTAEEAATYYKALKAETSGFSSIKLLLDGFIYGQLPRDNLATFDLLATSEYPRLSDSEVAIETRCLHPSWRRDDLFKLGERVFRWNEAVMTKRFYYSGGSARYFTLYPHDVSALHDPTTDDLSIRWIGDAIHEAVRNVDDLSVLFSSASLVRLGDKPRDRLWRTFVPPEFVADRDAYVDARHWNQVVDSEYALVQLRSRFIRADNVEFLLNCARKAGLSCASLVGSLFEVGTRRSAAENTLKPNFEEESDGAVATTEVEETSASAKKRSRAKQKATLQKKQKVDASATSEPLAAKRSVRSGEQEAE